MIVRRGPALSAVAVYRDGGQLQGDDIGVAAARAVGTRHRWHRRPASRQTVATSRDATAVALVGPTGSPNRKLEVTTVPFHASSW